MEKRLQDKTHRRSPGLHPDKHKEKNQPQHHRRPVQHQRQLFKPALYPVCQLLLYRIRERAENRKGKETASGKQKQSG